MTLINNESGGFSYARLYANEERRALINSFIWPVPVRLLFLIQVSQFFELFFKKENSNEWITRFMAVYLTRSVGANDCKLISSVRQTKWTHAPHNLLRPSGGALTSRTRPIPPVPIETIYFFTPKLFFFFRIKIIEACNQQRPLSWSSRWKRFF